MGKYLFLVFGLLTLVQPTAKSKIIPAQNSQILSYRTSIENNFAVDDVSGDVVRRLEAKINVREALAYLAKSELAQKIIHCAQSHDVEIVVANSKDNYNRINNKIFWDARKAAVFADGGTQSPAVILVHELSHACNYGQDPQSTVERADIDDSNYTDKEEEYVITQIETPIARDLQENVRYNHSANLYSVTSPTAR